MLYVVVHLYIEPGMGELLREYEQQALKIMNSYDGQLIAAFQPDSQASSPDPPDEIHILQFPSQERFDEFRNDPALLKLAALRARAIEKTHIFFSREIISY